MGELLEGVEPDPGGPAPGEPGGALVQPRPLACGGIDRHPLRADLEGVGPRVEHPVVAIQRPPDELGRRSRAWVDLLGGGAIDVPNWVRRIENDEFTELTIDPRASEAAADLHAAEGERRNGVLRLLGYHGDDPVLQVGDDRFNQLDRLTLLVTEGRPLELLAPHQLTLDDEAAAAPSATERTSEPSTETEDPES